MLRFFYLLQFFYFLTLSLSAQNTTASDSLHFALKNARSDSLKVDVMLNLSFFYKNRRDSAVFYAEKAEELSRDIRYFKGTGLSLFERSFYTNLSESESLLQKAEEIFMRIKDFKNLSDAQRYLADNQKNQGKYDVALKTTEKALSTAVKINNRKNITICYNTYGIIYRSLGNYEKAVENYYKVLKISEEDKNESSISIAYNNIGNVYYYQGNYEKAIEYYEKSVVIKKKSQDERGLVLTYSNIGESYTLLRQYEKSLEYAEKALSLAEKINQKKSIMQACRSLAHVHIVLKNFDKAEEILKKALFLSQNEKETERELLFRLLEVDFWQEKGDLKKAFLTAEIALDLAQKLKNAESLREAYEKHSLIAEKLKQDSVALLSFKKYISVRDSLANENNYKAALTKEFSYKAEKQQFEQEKKTLAMQAEMSVLERDKKILQKQAEAERLAELARSERDKRKADSLTNLANQNKLEAENLQILREKQDLEMKTERDAQKRITNTFLGIFCTILIILLLTTWGFRQKQKANRLLKLKNNEILSQKEEIAQHLILLEKQKNHIEKQHEDITNSINVGKRIQIASLPFDAHLKDLAADFFIFWRPRNIVSGDFYWFHEVSRSFTADTFHRIYIVGDCTGHGVPGAFMSMIGVNLLNDIVKVRKIISPDEILNMLRSGIYSALQQALTGSKEGMDIAVLSIEKTRRSKKILFAGAMNPLYYVQNSLFYELKGDKMPIGGKFDEKTYGLHEIFLSNEENMVLWLSSDGFQDQFGGENDKKFMVKKFKELLFSISEKKLDRQKEILEKTFDLWKGKQEQTDDVTVLGIRV